MEVTEFENKMTPAAKRTLDDITSEYRSQILLRAAKSAAKIIGSADEISVHDIIQGVKSAQIPSQSSSIIGQFLKLNAIIGVGIGAAGLLVYMYRNARIATNLDSQFPIILSVTGVIVSTISILAKKVFDNRSIIRSEKPEPSLSDNAGSFLLLWRDIELAIRETASSTLGESKASEPISLILRELHQEQILSTDDVTMLKSLLELRNKVIHGTAHGVSSKDVIEASRRANQLLKKLMPRSYLIK